MLIPYNADVPMHRWPIANWVIIAVTIGLTLYAWSNADGLAENHWLLIRGPDFSAWGLLGALVTHADFWHLAGNMVFLFCFGNAVNAKIGNIAYPIFYIGVGVVEGLLWLLVSHEEAVLGASGAIFGIMGAFLFFYPRNDVSVFYWIFVRPGTFSVASFWVIGTYIAINVISHFLGREDGTSYVSHLIGACTGMLVAYLLLVTRLVMPEPGEQTLVDVLRGSKPAPRMPEWERQARLAAGSAVTRSNATPSRGQPHSSTGPMLSSAPRRRTPADDAPIPLADESPGQKKQIRIEQPRSRPGPPGHS